MLGIVKMSGHGPDNISQDNAFCWVNAIGSPNLYAQVDTEYILKKYLKQIFYPSSSHRMLYPGSDRSHVKGLQYGESHYANVLL